MTKHFNKLLASLDNSTDGYSARKLTALTLTICIVYIHWKYVDLTTAIDAMVVDLCGVLIALGIVTAEQLIRLKHGTDTGTDNRSESARGAEESTNSEGK